MDTNTPTPTSIPAPLPTMPRHDRDNEVLTAVAADHAISQACLADITGISHSFISRVFSGQYAAPPALLRAMWEATHDHRVLRIALGDNALREINTQPTDQRRALALQTAASIGLVAEGLARITAGTGNPVTLRAHIADACRAMRSLDSHLQTAQAGKVDLCA